MNDRDRISCRNLVSRHQDAVFQMCNRVLKDRELAEEVAQDVFVKAFGKLNQLNEPEKFPAWILRMAYHSSIDRYRKLKKSGQNLENQVIVDPDPGPDELLDTIYRSQHISIAIRSLGEPDNSIFRLFYLDEWKVTAIAKKLGLSESNIKIRLMRGRKLLSEKLKNLINEY